jgi:hypothetical protein
MSKNTTDPLALEGRLFDGNAYGVVTKDGNTHRICDYAGPDGVWAKIQQAKKAGEDVVFTGARSVAGGKLDGFAILPASEITGLRNWGPSILGAGAFEAKLAKIEDEMTRMGSALTSHAEAINQIEADVDELEVEVFPEGEGEGQGEGGQVSPIPLGTDAPLSPEAAQALAAASGDEED